MLLLNPLCLVAAASLGASSPYSCENDVSSSLSATSHVTRNANHIFNTIHSSMRQWGSSLHHNGMSFFLAHIPEGTELYHGRGDSEPVRGMEWLAFEPEHALNFARNMSRGGPGEGGRPPPPDKGKVRGPPPREGWSLFHLFQGNKLPRQRPLDDTVHHKADKKYGPGRGGFQSTPGFLHTYSMKHDLNVVYIDGESAAKSEKGTLDTQDYILAPQGDNNDDEEHGHGPRGEFGRATDMCKLAANEWGGRIHGFLRMEHGFELILCDFEKDAEPVHIMRVGKDGQRKETDGGMSEMALFSAIGARYHGIGGERVTINYDNFVTAFATEINLFHNGEYDLPRLNSTSPKQRTSLLNDLTKIVRTERSPTKGINWQSIIDMIIARYSDTIFDLAFDRLAFQTKALFDRQLTLLLRPFIDFDARNTSAEISRCAAHFLPWKYHSSSVAGTAILEVSTQMCTTLYAVQEQDETLKTARAKLQDLIKWLDWTSWKECRPGCKYGEVCFTAIWPFGDIESHERPYCVNATGLNRDGGRGHGSNSYWGGMSPLR